MSRLIKEDFDKLCTFIKDYSLSDVLKIDDAKKLLSSFHKKYFAYLVLIEGIHHKIEQYDEVLKMSKEQYEYLQESCSDVGQAFFLTFHGCYKGAKLLLRSSKARATGTFKETKANLHAQLHNEYALLCQDVHTADVSHMASITALNHFPSFHNEDAGNILKMVQKIIPIYITTIALKYNLAYHSMSYNYKEITNKEIINDYKKEVHNIV